MSFGESARSRDQRPLISPRERIPYAVIAMPSSRQAGRISSSIEREISEYSIWRSATGRTEWARRIVSAPASESPTWRTQPASIISPMKRGLWTR